LEFLEQPLVSFVLLVKFPEKQMRVTKVIVLALIVILVFTAVPMLSLRVWLVPKVVFLRCPLLQRVARAVLVSILQKWE
jgi:hypothetical protein